MRQVLTAVLVLATLAGCAAPRASVMAMRDIPADQQERDRRECEAHAGYADVAKPISHALLGTIGGTLTGIGVGAAVILGGAWTTNDPGDAALYVGVAAGLGAAVGFLAGTAIGARSGARAAHNDYFARYTDCMRERGYAVFRERG